MTTKPEQVDLWRQAPSEHQHLEFKEAKHQFDTRRLSEYCVALANEGGGVLLLGVADRPPRPVVGTHAFPDTLDAADDAPHGHLRGEEQRQRPRGAGSRGMPVAAARLPLAVPSVLGLRFI